jgi:hypothetical protein
MIRLRRPPELMSDGKPLAHMDICTSQLRRWPKYRRLGIGLTINDYLGRLEPQ